MNWFWKSYKRLICLPSGTVGWERKLGIALYAISTLVGVYLVYLTIRSETASYIDYSTKKGGFEFAPDHRLPDFVVCPARRLDRKYGVMFNEMIIGYLNLTNQALDELTERYHSTCSVNERCRGLAGIKCENEFTIYCEGAQKIFEWMIEESDGTPRNFTKSDPRCPPLLHQNNVDAIDVLLRFRGRKFDLQSLWLSIISPYYASVWRNGVDNHKNRTHEILCHLYRDNAEDNKGIKECRKAGDEMWIGNSLCFAVMGNRMNSTASAFFGFSLPHMIMPDEEKVCKDIGWYPNNFWIGNLQNMEVRWSEFRTPNKKRKRAGFEFQLASHAAAVAYYSMIHSVNSNRPVKVAQPNIRGFRFIEKHSENSEWFYELQYHSRQLQKPWIYHSAIQTIHRNSAFTFYTELQLATSILGSLIGLSALQIIEFASTCILKWLKRGQSAVLAIKIILMIGLVVLTSCLTYFDMADYLGSRYTKVFKRLNRPLPIPVVKVCNQDSHAFSFINVTREYEYNVSLELHSFLKFAAWHQPGNFINLIFALVKTRNPLKPTHYIVPEWMLKNYAPYLKGHSKVIIKNETFLTMPGFNLKYHEILSPLNVMLINSMRMKNLKSSRGSELRSALIEEMRTIALQAGLRKNAALVDFLRFFSLDPSLLIKRCQIWGQDIERCGTFASYTFESWRSDLCLTLNIPDTGSKGTRIGGYRNRLEIVYDSEEYFWHSDAHSYYGPGQFVEHRKNFNDTICSGLDYQRRSGFLASWCRPPNSWRLKIHHPTWALEETEVRLSPRGLLRPKSYAIDVRLGFDAKNSVRGERGCLETHELECRFPRQEALAVMKALQMQILCNCSTCFTRNPEFLERIQSLVGKRKTYCCTAELYIRCHEKYQKNLTWNETAHIYSGPEEIKEIFRRKLFLPAISLHTDTSKYLNTTPEDILRNKQLWRADKLGPEAVERLAQYLRKCFRETCNKESINQVNLQEEAPTPGEIKIKIFYGSSSAIGTEEIDRLDAPHLLLVLLCGYGMTFGISFLGLIEIIMIAVNRAIDRESDIGKTIRQHILRNMGVISEPETPVSVEIKAIQIEPSLNEPVVFSNRNGQPVILVPTPEPKTPSHLTPNDPAVPGTSFQYNLDDERVSAYHVIKKSKTVSPFFIRSLPPGVKIRASNEVLPGYSHSLQRTVSVVSSDISEIEIADFGHGYLEEDSIEGIVEIGPVQENNFIMNRAESRAEEKTKKDFSGRIMTISFIILSIVMTVMITICFMTVQRYEYDAVVVDKPVYQKPSVFLCVNDSKPHAELWENLQSMNCSVLGEAKSCQEVFNTIVVLNTEAFCFLFDQSHELAPLDDRFPILYMEAPQRYEELRLLITGLNGTSLQNLNPYIRWQQESLQMQFSARIEESYTDCTNEIPGIPCPICPTDGISTNDIPFICCPGKKQLKTAVIEKKTCFNTEFALGFFRSSANGDKKTLTLRASGRSALVFSVSPKNSHIGLFFLFGEFVGSFVELTILNVICAIVFWVAKLILSLTNAR